MSTKFDRVSVTQEMIGSGSRLGLYPHSKPGIYVEIPDGDGKIWLYVENPPYGSCIITCPHCGSEFVNNFLYADSPAICPYCGKERATVTVAAPVEFADISSGLGIGGAGSDDYNIHTETDCPTPTVFGKRSGQLWQECEKPGCHNEPVCATCFMCEARHCHCAD